jgi:hypothetical protein
VTDYTKSFAPALIEETHADLFSNITALSQAPIIEIEDVKTSKNFRPPNDLFYEITLERVEDSELKSVQIAEKDGGKYEPEAGDIIALTDVRPKCTDDLNRPKRLYLIAYVLGTRDIDSNKVPIRASKPILTDEQDVRKLDAANSSSGSWDATRTQSQDNNLYVVRPILPTSTEHTRYITISL